MDFSKIHPRGDYVERDWTDLRDRPYTPSLAVLKSAVVPERAMLRAVADRRSEFAFGVRHQGQTGRCTGYALAALIDLQRCHQALREGAPSACDGEVVSADMLFRMGAFHEFYGPRNGARLPKERDEPTGLRSLRSVIKGFYHHGVCFDMPTLCAEEEAQKRWRSACYMHPDEAATTKLPSFPTVPQAKAARAIALGAYYRVEPILNSFHAALNEVGAILVSANIHDGWYKPRDGEIPHEDVARIGTHAFVLVGYDDVGFLVLNSWGPEWGGYQPRGTLDSLAGVARWHYADWAENIVDAWVLRLGVSAPSAFDKSIGEQGAMRLFGQVESRTPPCFELVGHFMHLDDGRYVDHGSYPSFPDVWQKTAAYLSTALSRERRKNSAPPKKAADYRGILVWIPGSLEGIKTAFELAALRKNTIKSLGLYPYSIFWCSRFVDKSMEVLGTVFRGCKEQAGEDQKHLDLVIEDSISGIGRAFWRDLERGAAEAVTHAPDGRNGSLPGPAGDILLDIVRLCEETGAELHLVVEGAGALVLDRLLADWSTLVEMRRANPEKDRPAPTVTLTDCLSSLSLVMPAIGMAKANDHILPLVEQMNRDRRQKSSPVPAFDPVKLRRDEKPSRTKPLPARIYVPDIALEERIGFSTYGKSILHLVANAFAERIPVPSSGCDDPATRDKPPPQTLLGMHKACAESPAGAQAAFSLIQTASDPRYASGRVPQTAISADPGITAEIFRTIRTLDATRTRRSSTAR